MAFEFDLTGSVSLDQFNTALDEYNQMHTMAFSLSGSDSDFSLVGGDDVYAEGDLQQIAYFWEGYVSGQRDGDTSLDIDANDDGF